MANPQTASPAAVPAVPAVPTEATMPGLADIQEPLLENDWYLAPAWSLLWFLLFIVLSFAVYKWWRYFQEQKPVKYALCELAKIDLTAPNAVEMITVILKRILITKTPAHPAIAMSGHAWQQYLLTSLPTGTQPAGPLPDLSALHYQLAPAPKDIELYADFAKMWLKKAKFTTLGATHA